ncbi:MAG: hypothetical protein K2H17_06875 [Duncaniella sp.]|uniref:hypothetical protein n=1 Tax=Duncaniella sp. TaxID=2518496 RepID=UPI0023C524AC|nr:hypothetical protein [Duncaniella sp.]MDE5989104.1 hypothetical protein [Duncaniella sp.]
MGVKATRVVKYIRKGDNGSDAVRYWLSPSVSAISVREIDRYGDGKPTPDKISCRLIKQIGGNDPMNIANSSAEGLAMFYAMKQINGSSATSRPYSGDNIYVPTNTAYCAIEFYLYRSGELIDTVTVPIVHDGEPGGKGDKGDRGPTLRGPQAWSDCATGYAFKSGAKGEAWKDVVLYGNNYYSCIKSHTKTASNYPGSTTDQSNGYWQLGDKIELVATKILLASYALVKNLGVESIDMRDAAGNILFQAKDGNVTCKTGAFENIKVSGDLTATKFSLKLADNDQYGETPNGSLCYRTSAVYLEELPSGTTRMLKILNPGVTRSGASPLHLINTSDSVYISTEMTDAEGTNSPVIVENGGYNMAKYFELIGVNRGDGKTIWYLIQTNNN